MWDALKREGVFEMGGVALMNDPAAPLLHGTYRVQLGRHAVSLVRTHHPSAWGTSARERHRQLALVTSVLHQTLGFLPPGYDNYSYGGSYGYRDFCDINLVDEGYAARHSGYGYGGHRNGGYNDGYHGGYNGGYNDGHYGGYYGGRSYGGNRGYAGW